MFYPFFVEDKDVSKHTTTKELMKGSKMSSFNLMKFVGELVKMKGMTNHMKKTSLDLKEVFHTSVFLIGT